MTARPLWNVLDAELVDTLQADRARRHLPLHVRTAETRSEWPRPVSRIKPKLSCPYCGKRRCGEHSDLPKLDPYFNGIA